MKRVSELYFEELGENFDQFMSSYDVSRRSALIERLMNMGLPSGNALEVGCGTGALTHLLKRPNLTVTVGDISEKLALQTAQRLSVTGCALDACKINFPDKSFDVVMSSEVIEHTPDPKTALREMARVLKPDGVLIVTSPNRLWYPLLWITMKLGIRKFCGNEFWLWPHEAAQTLRECGLSVECVTGCHLFPWQVPGAKSLLPFFDRFGQVLGPLMINYGIRATAKV